MIYPYDFDKEYSSYCNTMGMYVDYKGKRELAIPIVSLDNLTLWKTRETFVLIENGEMKLCDCYLQNRYMPPFFNYTVSQLKEIKKIKGLKIYQSGCGNYINYQGRRFYIGDINKYTRKDNK